MIRMTIVTLLAIALSGCIDSQSTGDHHGDGHHHDEAEGTRNLPITGAEDTVLTVTAGNPDEFRFVLDRIEVQSGQRIGIVFANEGSAAHEFSIEAIEFHLHAQSGTSETASFIAPTRGEYVIGCFIPGHFEAGMSGVLVVS